MEEIEIQEIFGIQTIKNETFIQTNNENGQEVLIKFKTIELLEWINKEDLKEGVKKYIETL